jgi:hypothetical protein
MTIYNRFLDYVQNDKLLIKHPFVDTPAEAVVEGADTAENRE